VKKILVTIWNKHQEKTLILQDQAIVSASNFFNGLLLSKLLGLTELGTYALFWMMLMICSSLLQNFIQIPMVNEYVLRRNTDGSQYLDSLFSNQLLLSFSIAILSGLAIFFLNAITFFEALQSLTWIAPLFIFSYLMQDFMRRAFVLKGQLYRLVLIDFLVNGSQVFYLLLFLNDSSISLASILVFFSYTYLVGFVVGSHEFLRQLSFHKEIFQTFKRHWNLATWLLATACLQWFAGNYFIISAADHLDTESVGIIRIVQSLVGVLNVFFIGLEYYVPQKLAQVYKNGGKKALFNYTFLLTIGGSLLCISVATFMYFWGQELLTIIYGRSYAQYNSTLVQFSFFYVLVFIGYPLRFALRVLNNNKNMFIAYGIAVLFSLTFADRIVQEWKIVGVIAGLAISQILMQGWYVLALFRSPENNQL
jgi:O-antigen/teichoic acid export membrane protein